jgi:hypothetical protein
VGIGWPRALFVIFEFEHKCSFAKILAHKDGNSQSTSIENTDQEKLKGKFSNMEGREKVPGHALWREGFVEKSFLAKQAPRSM